MEKRPTSVPGLVRTVVLQRWEKLGRVGQLGVIAAFFALLGGAFALAATSMCGAGGCNMRRAETPCHLSAGATEEPPCPYSAGATGEANADAEAAPEAELAAHGASPCGG
ncbi:MAG: hypothetical protein AAF447_27525 [Myxococcota bacterium]